MPYNTNKSKHERGRGISKLSDKLELPCGAILPNRLAKSAMTEGLADSYNHATEAHRKLYKVWADGGIGLCVTGNVQIDYDHLERPGNIVISGMQSEQQLERLRKMAQAGNSNGGHIWVQISHSGRQTPASVNKSPKAPSAVALKNMPKGQFGNPQEMTSAEIQKVISGFANAAKVAKDVGFNGVQVHSAHGYLLSSFLSPLTNCRADEYGGSLENRARILLKTIGAIREAVGEHFPVGVKLNSADFQESGFSKDDSAQVAQWLEEAGVDLLELSGGNYESAAMMGASTQKKESTKKREAYFLEYAADIRAKVKMPITVTGGFRSRAAMEEALASNECDVIGLARPLCTDTNLPNDLIAGNVASAPRWENELGFLKMFHNINLIRLANAWGVQGWFCLQLIRMGAGLKPKPKMSPLACLFKYAANESRTANAMHKARAVKTKANS